MDWDKLLNQLYWHVEHGEHATAIVKLRELRVNGWKEGVTAAALFVGSAKTEQGDQYGSCVAPSPCAEQLAAALLEFRDKTPEKYIWS